MKFEPGEQALHITSLLKNDLEDYILTLSGISGSELWIYDDLDNKEIADRIQKDIDDGHELISHERTSNLQPLCPELGSDP